MEIDKTKPILVTGATGYVAGWLVKKLVENGYTVHAAVRNPEKKEKVQHLDAIAQKGPGEIKYFKTDLLVQGSYAQAMNGCELVFHTASPYTIDVKDPQEELVDPAVKGTENVLNQANMTESVKRVVLTSSCAAIYTDAVESENAPNGELTEDIWNTTASLDYQPYFYSKTLAERRAWELTQSQRRWDLVVLNPPGVFGPFLNPSATTSESFNQIKQLGDGTLKQGVPDIGFGVIDVRDLADTHMKAGFTSSASGRYIVRGHNTSFLKMAEILHQEYGQKFPIPNKKLPKWLLYLVGPLINKAITWKFIKNNVNHSWKASNRKVTEELGVKFRPLKETLVDSFQVLVDNKIVSEK